MSVILVGSGAWYAPAAGGGGTSPSLPVSLVAPAVSGTLEVGATLTSSLGAWSNSPTGYDFKWQRSLDGVSASDITGATSQTYVPVAGDQGYRVRSGVAARNTEGTAAFTYSAWTNALAPVGPTVAVTTLQLTSETSGSLLPWTFGHAFKEGDVPSAYNLVGNSPDFQATVTTRWPDGSVKHAIIAGRSNFAAPGTVSVVLSRGSAQTDAALTTDDLKAALIAGTTSITVSGTTMTLAGGLLDSPQRTVCTGPVMSNWIYRLPVAGSNHLVIWCDVRLYKGGTVELFPWVENAYLSVASPATVTGVACSVVVAGSSRFSQTFDISHRSRIPLVSGTTFSHWTSDPQITPKHDPAYLRATKMVPNYGTVSPSSATLDALQQTYSPNTLAGMNTAMGNSGGNAALIGFNTKPAQPFYCITGDARAYRASIVFGLSGGSWPVHYRDESTNEPIRYDQRPNHTLQDSSVPAGTGSTNGTPDAQHQPSFAFLPWLITGRWWFLDEQLFWTTYNYLRSPVANRRGGNIGFGASSYLFATSDSGIVDPRAGAYEPRGAAWAINSIAAALAILPDTHPCYGSIKTAWERNAQWFRALFVDGTFGTGWVNSLGTLGMYSSGGNSNYDAVGYLPGTGGRGTWWDAGFQHAQQAMVWGRAAHDLGLPVSTQARQNTTAVAAHVLKYPTGLAGDGSSGSWNWRRFGVFAFPVGTDDIGTPPESWYATFGAARAVYESALGSLPATAGASMMYHSSNTPIAGSPESTATYVGQALVGLSYAVTAGIPGAASGFGRITGYDGQTASSSWSHFLAAYTIDPTYYIVPRMTTPAWLAALNLSVFQWGQVPNTALSTHDASVGITSGLVPGITGPRSKVEAWCGGALKDSGSEYIVGASGGHGDWCGNEVQSIRLADDAPMWTTRRMPTSTADIYGYEVPAYADGRRSPTHTYYALQFDQTGDRLFLMPSPGPLMGGIPNPPPDYPYPVSDAPRKVMSFSLATNDWNAYGTHANRPIGTGDFTSCMVAVHGGTGEIFYGREGDGNLLKFNPTTDAWSTVKVNFYPQNYGGCAIDHTRGRMLQVGGYGGGVAPRVWDTTTGNAVSVTFGGLGAAPLTAIGQYPGVLYEPVRDSFLVFHGGSGGALLMYEVSASTYTVTQPTMLNTPSGFQYGQNMVARPNGILTGIRYCPELRGVVFHRDYFGNLWFMRTN